MTKVVDYTTTLIPTTEILKDDKFNCRGEFDSQSLETLAQSIHEIGLQTPITVMPIQHPMYKYKVVCGHRRFAACKLARIKEIPTYVRDLSELDATVLNLVENIERKNLNIVEEANGLAAIFRQGLSIDQIAKRTNLGRRYIEIRLKLLCLPKKVQELAAINSISVSDLKTIIAAYDVGKTDAELERIAENAFHIRTQQKDLSKNQLLSKRAQEDLNPTPERVKPKMLNIAEVDSILEVAARAYGKVGITDAPMVQALRWFVKGISTYELLKSMKDDLALLGETYIIPEQYGLEHDAHWAKQSYGGNDLSDSEAEL